MGRRRHTAEQTIREVLAGQTGEEFNFFSQEARAIRVSPDIDFCLETKIAGNPRLLCFDVKSGPLRNTKALAQRSKHFRTQNSGKIYVLAVPDLSERAKRLLQSHGVNYVDYTGNIWIREPGLYVNIDASRGRRTKARGRQGKNPFSKKASLVVRAYLQHPHQVWGVREMSEEAGLSVGYTSEVMRELQSRRYTREEPEGHRLNDPVHLLRDWTDAYSWEDNETYSFVIPSEKEQVAASIRKHFATASEAFAFTLLTATDYLLPHVNHDQTQLYVRQAHVADLTAFVQEELYGEPVSEGGNCDLLVPYYGQATFYGARSIDGIPLVSNEQLFLDLVHYPVRGVEAAGVLARRILAEQLELSSEDLRSLREWLEA